MTNALIKSALRKLWLWSAERQEAIANGRIERGKYKCAKCKKTISRTEFEVDHIKPVAPFIDWNTYIERLFCPVSNLQLLCKPCHKKKTKAQK